MQETSEICCRMHVLHIHHHQRNVESWKLSDTRNWDKRATNNDANVFNDVKSAGSLPHTYFQNFRLEVLPLFQIISRFDFFGLTILLRI